MCKASRCWATNTANTNTNTNTNTKTNTNEIIHKNTTPSRHHMCLHTNNLHSLHISCRGWSLTVRWEPFAHWRHFSPSVKIQSLTILRRQKFCRVAQRRRGLVWHKYWGSRPCICFLLWRHGFQCQRQGFFFSLFFGWVVYLGQGYINAYCILPMYIVRVSGVGTHSLDFGFGV